MSKATALTVASRACCNASSLASGGATARPAAAARRWRTNLLTRPRHLLKVDIEAPVAVHTLSFSIVGHTTCSSTACSAFTVPNSARFAPSAIARVRATWCAQSVLVCALCMQWHASSSACSGVSMVYGGVEPHAAGLSTCTMQALCCASSARPVVAISASAAAASSDSPHVVSSAKKLDGDATDSLLEGGPSGSEGGGEYDGVGPPASLGSVGGYEGRAGWRCDRHRRRGGGRGAARRRGGVRLRSGAARCAPRVASLALPPPSGFAAPAPSLHSCDAGTTPPCAVELGIVARCDPDDAIGQSDSHQRELAGEAQAMGSVNQNIKEEHEGDQVLPLQERRAYGSRSHHKANHVKCHGQQCQNYPSPGAHPLASPRVVRAGAVEQHAACEPNSNTEHDSSKVSPHAWLYERFPGEVSEGESHQEDMSWIGHAEELRSEGRLVSGVCEGPSDTVHVSRRRGLRRSLEDSVGASRRRRRRRLEIWVVAPQGVSSEKPRHSRRSRDTGKRESCP
eukprot:scaffold91257_cov65-Phaeocystis_antarctica.AAC.1